MLLQAWLNVLWNKDYWQVWRFPHTITLWQMWMCTNKKWPRRRVWDIFLKLVAIPWSNCNYNIHLKPDAQNIIENLKLIQISEDKFTQAIVLEGYPTKFQFVSQSSQQIINDSVNYSPAYQIHYPKLAC